MNTCSIAENLGEVFNLANWQFYGKLSKVKSAIFYSDERSRYAYVYRLGFVMSPNLKLTKLF